MKEVSRGRWLAELGLVEVLKAGGNYWRTTGFSINARSFLYPEEALFLAEERKIVVEDKGQALSLETLYQMVLRVIPLPCYLVYLKLKVHC